jgi:hypothetical protein
VSLLLTICVPRVPSVERKPRPPPLSPLSGGHLQLDPRTVLRFHMPKMSARILLFECRQVLVLSWASLASLVPIAPLGLPTTSPSLLVASCPGLLVTSADQCSICLAGSYCPSGLLLPLYVSQGHMNPAQELDHLVNLTHLTLLAHTPA